MMADELSRWRQPGWGNYKRASKPPPAAAKEGEERKKVWPLLLLFAPSNCPLNRSIFALPPDRRLCETNSLGIFRKLQSTREACIGAGPLVRGSAGANQR